MNTAYNEKLIISGRFVEHYQYELAVVKGYSCKKKGRASVATVQNHKDNRKKTALRAKRNVMRVINCNPQLNKFLTLTFADNVCDLDIAQSAFNIFNTKIKRKFPSFKYVCVVEFQKRGAIHFHLLCNLPYLDPAMLAKIWSNGFIKINKIDNVENIGAYVTKYMTKSNIDDRLDFRRCYSMSRGLKKPVTVTAREEVTQVLQNLEGIKKVYSNEYTSEENGVVICTFITLKEPFNYRNFWERLHDRFGCTFSIPVEYLPNPFRKIMSRQP